jgi:large subunit ribosomal protein L25
MSDTHGKLTVKLRTRSGKGVARKLRAAGETPGVLYGQGKDNVLISVSPRDLRRSLDPERKLNTFFELSVEGGDGTEQCIISDIQLDPIKDTILHVDFLRVDPDFEVQTKIPVEYVGRAAGVALGGKLRTFRRTLKISAKPREIPIKLTVDVTPLGSGQSLRLGALSLENATFLEKADTVMALVESPRGATEDKAEEKEAAS